MCRGNFPRQHLLKNKKLLLKKPIYVLNKIARETVKRLTNKVY